MGLDTEATDRTVRLQSTVWKPSSSYSLGARAQRLRGLERELDTTRQVRDSVSLSGTGMCHIAVIDRICDVQARHVQALPVGDASEDPRQRPQLHGLHVFAPRS